ncbi:MAG TPA: hypothetical protein VLH83_06115 [Chthoniobacterales bacterium]|nr:hypothetical protein [Chthoniobacterales bacterium]
MATQFKKPAKPLSYKATVHKILEDAAYAKFFHGLLLKARKGDKEAEKNLAAHFQLAPRELKEFKLPKGYGYFNCANCTDTTGTTTVLFCFVTPVHIWPKKTKKD